MEGQKGVMEAGREGGRQKEETTGVRKKQRGGETGRREKLDLP